MADYADLQQQAWDASRAAAVGDAKAAVVKAMFRAFLSVLDDAGIMTPARRRKAWKIFRYALKNENGLQGLNLDSIISYEDEDIVVEVPNDGR